MKTKNDEGPAGRAIIPLLHRYAPVVPIFFAAFIFLPPYIDSFILDDYKHIEFIRPVAERPWGAYEMASPFWIGWYYRPVQHWVVLGAYLIFGVSSVGYYIILIGIHVANIALLARLARACGVASWGVLVSVSLFALNAIHLDVLGWMSSVSVATAAFFIEIGILAYLRYLAKPAGREHWLVLLFVSWILALFSREEMIVYLLLLPILRRLHPGAMRVRWAELATYASMFLFSVLYSIVQWIRPTWTGRPGAHSIDLWLESVLQGRIFVLLTNGVQRLSLPWLGIDVNGVVAILAGAFISLALLFWLWRGNWITRLGILSAVALLTLTFLTLLSWSADSVPGRYLYLPWLNWSLAIGATVSDIVRRFPATRGIFILATAALIVPQLPLIEREQQRIYGESRIVQDIRRQMLSLVPSPGDDTSFYAHYLFPLTDYVQAQAVVWYDRPFKAPGGHLGRLRSLGYATDDVLVFNYEEGVLYNLMPELQEADETYLLWQDDPVAEVVHPDGSSSPLDESAYTTGGVVGPPGERRYGFYLHPPAPQDGWASLAFAAVVPQDGVLSVFYYKDVGGVPGEDGMTFRVRVINADSRPLTLFEETIGLGESDGDGGWCEAQLDLSNMAGMSVTIRLEVHAGANLLHDHGYWANPRFVVDS